MPGGQETKLSAWPMAAVLLIGLVCFSSRARPGRAEEPGATAAAAPELLDAVAAVVDGDLITLSDLRVARALGPDVMTRPDRPILDALIEERLMAHEASRIPVVKVQSGDITAALANFKSRFAGDEEYRAFLASIDLGEKDLENMFERKLLIEHYIDYRLRPFVMVEPFEVDEALRKHPTDGLSLELDPRRTRDAQRKVLEEAKLAEAVEEWVSRLREKTRVDVVARYAGTTGGKP